MTPENEKTIVLDLSTPENFEKFSSRFERTRRLSPNELMDFSNFVREFNREGNKPMRPK